MFIREIWELISQSGFYFEILKYPEQISQNHVIMEKITKNFLNCTVIQLVLVKAERMSVFSLGDLSFAKNGRHHLPTYPIFLKNLWFFEITFKKVELFTPPRTSETTKWILNSK